MISPTPDPFQRPQALSLDQTSKDVGTGPDPRHPAPGLRVALVHDWLTGMRGGEKVLESFCRVFPQAEIFTLFYQPGSVSEVIAARKITASWLDRLPSARRHYRWFLPFFPQAIESLKLDGFDLVISISHAVAKGVRSGGARHICYCETPMRYVWDVEEDYFRFGSGRRWKRALLGLARGRLRAWDLRSNARVDHFLANSENVRQCIARLYGRDATVIYPPVDTDFFNPGPRPPAPGPYFLVVSALEPYKRVDLAVEAFARLKLPLLVAGRGTEERALRRLAPANVEFLGWVTDERLRELYRGCRALVFPGVEDFGIVPVEAQACGRPVVAFGRGGALETVLDGRTGVFFPEQTAESLAEAVRCLDKLDFHPAEARRNSLRFSRQRFEDEVRAFFDSQVTAFGVPRELYECW